MKYDYKCNNPKCSEYNKVFEHEKGIKDPKPQCSECGETVETVFLQAAEVKYKGKWFSNTGSY